MCPGNHLVVVRTSRTGTQKEILVQKYVGRRSTTLPPLQGARKTKTLTPMETLAKRARRLIAKGPLNWSRMEMQKCQQMLTLTWGLMHHSRFRDKELALSIYNVLKKAKATSDEQLARRRRRIEAQVVNPDRHRIAVYGSASGRVRWGTTRKSK